MAINAQPLGWRDLSVWAVYIHYQKRKNLSGCKVIVMFSGAFWLTFRPVEGRTMLISLISYLIADTRLTIVTMYWSPDLSVWQPDQKNVHFL